MRYRTGNAWVFAAGISFFVAQVGIFFLGQIIFYNQTVYYFRGNFVVLFLYAVNMSFACRIYRGFSFGNADLPEIVLSWILSLFVANSLQYLMLSLIMRGLLSAIGFIVIFMAQLLLVVPLTFLIDRLYYRLHPAHIASIIYRREERAHEYRDIIGKLTKKFQITRVMSENEPIGTLRKCIDASGSVFFLDVDGDKLDRLLEYCYMQEKRSYILPTFTGVLLNSARASWVSHTLMFLPRSSEIDLGTRIVKRSMDVVISLVAIILFSWLMLITFAAIVIYDRHPAIYKQVRMTKSGKQFTLYKFRSMCPDAESNGVARLAARRDSRVTPIGRFMRRTRIDELPQLFNVLSGSMSLVGPRPERPEIARQYAETYPNFAFRTKVKAGLTGLAQVYGRYNTAPEDKLFLDVMYIETLSIWGDVKLLMQTLKPIFTSSSTEGVADGSMTALEGQHSAS